MKQPHTPLESARIGAPELELLLACTRWPQRQEDRDTIRLLAAERLDWERFLLLAEHHRLVPLVAHTLQAALGPQASLPPQASLRDAEWAEQRLVLERLGRLAGENTYRSLRSLAEMKRVVQEFRVRGVKVRVLKGIPLAQRVFGDLSLRSTGDLDLLVDEDSILLADEVLRGFGYRGLFQVERFSPKRFSFYRAHWKDIAYRSAATGFEVDLHWRCFRNSEMPGADLCATPTGESVWFGSFEVETPPAMETLLYLCVHGTLDGWLYLKSLADVGAQVRAMMRPQLDALAGLAAGYGVLPELTAALILVRRYLGMDHRSDRLLAATDPTVEHILRYADRALEQGGFLADRSAIPASATMAFELGLRRNFRYRFEVLLRVLFRARMWETIPLPDFLFGIYPLLSPFEWVVFRVRQRLAKPSPGAAPSIE